MKDWRKTLILPGKSIFDAIRIIDNEALQIAVIVDEDYHLLGVVTDGDIRRALLTEVNLHSEIRSIMTKNPHTARMGESRKQILNKMKNYAIHQLPLVNEIEQVVGLYTLDELIRIQPRDNIVVLMAGGLGSRLMPLTNGCPKPLLKVGGKPILEIILENFIDYGFYRFYFCINYKAEMIKEHFGDGSLWGVNIQYIHEDKRLGTAGALSLLPDKAKEPLVVMNGDLLTKIDFQQLLDFHVQNKATATMCIREYENPLPYGVVKLKDDIIVGLKEKPVQKHLINAGIYVLNPEVLDLIPEHTFFDMNQLFEALLVKGHNPAAYQIREYWMDIGRISDLEIANAEYHKLFA